MAEPMTPERLAAIRDRVGLFSDLSHDDAVALLAEVDRLGGELGRTQQRLADAGHALDTYTRESIDAVVRMQDRVAAACGHSPTPAPPGVAEVVETLRHLRRVAVIVQTGLVDVPCDRCLYPGRVGVCDVDGPALAGSLAVCLECVIGVARELHRKGAVMIHIEIPPTTEAGEG